MGCGCKDRQEMGRHMVSAFKSGDMASVGKYGRDMAQSLGNDVGGMLRVKSSWSSSKSPASLKPGWGQRR